MGPFSGPILGARFWPPKLVHFSGPNITKKQADAVWQWYNSCAAQVPVGKTPLRINVDETSVCLFQGGGKGTVMFKKRRDPPAAEPRERASRGKRRACLTHVAFVCDRPDIQPLLPQVLVGNFATFLVREMAALKAAAPPNVHLIRQKTAWNNKQLMAWIITRLAVALSGFTALLQPILLLDAAHTRHTLSGTVRLAHDWYRHPSCQSRFWFACLYCGVGVGPRTWPG